MCLAQQNSLIFFKSFTCKWKETIIPRASLWPTASKAAYLFSGKNSRSVVALLAGGQNTFPIYVTFPCGSTARRTQRSIISYTATECRKRVKTSLKLQNFSIYSLETPFTNTTEMQNAELDDILRLWIGMSLQCPWKHTALRQYELKGDHFF